MYTKRLFQILNKNKKLPCAYFTKKKLSNGLYFHVNFDNITKK